MDLTSEDIKIRLNDSAYDYRVKSLKAYLSSPVRDYKESPTTKDYVEIKQEDLDRLVNPTVSSDPAIPDQKLGESDLVLANGRIMFSSEKIDEGGVTVDTIMSVIQNDSAFSQKFITDRIGKDRIEHLINATFSDGVFLYIPPGMKKDLSITSYDSSGDSLTSKIVIACGEESNVTLRLTSYSTGSGNGVHGKNVYLYLEKRSKLKFEYIQEKEKSVTDITFVRSFLEDFAEFKIFHINRGSAKTLFSNESEMYGEGSDFRTYGVSFSEGDQRMDIRDSSFQVGIGCNADIQVRGAVAGKSSTLHRGNIDIEAESINSTGFYDSKILLLSRDGFANSKPALMIKNANTKSKHGSAISDVDEDQILYLRSRGIDPKSARAMIMEGFLGAPMEKSSDDFLMKKVHEFARDVIGND
jgi:Fe-S cluster assembly scaffold protein SufB